MRRDLARLRFVREQIWEIEQARLAQLAKAPGERRNTMVCLLARVVGVGVETADMLVNEVLSRTLRDRRAVARYAGLTGAPDESGAKRREKGLAKVGNARVRRGMLQLAWRFLRFQAESSLAGRLEVTDALRHQQSLDAVRVLAPLDHKPRPFARPATGVLLLGRGHVHHAADLRLTALQRHQRAQEPSRIQPVRLGHVKIIDVPSSSRKAYAVAQRCRNEGR